MITDSIKWRVGDVSHELIRNEECREVFVFKRGDNLPQFFTAEEAVALSMQIRRMADRSDFVFASKNWANKIKGG